MLAIVGGRMTGKTTALIKLSSMTGFPIVVPTHEMARRIYRRAEDTGRPIPRPLPWDQFMSYLDGRRSERPAVLIDELEWCLERDLGCKVAAVSVLGEAVSPADPESPRIGEMGFLEMLRAWRSARKKARSTEVNDDADPHCHDVRWVGGQAMSDEFHHCGECWHLSCTSFGEPSEDGYVCRVLGKPTHPGTVTNCMGFERRDEGRDGE